MPNMLDYMAENGDKSFRELPFGPVDGLVFAQLSYCDYQAANGELPASLQEIRPNVQGGVKPEDAALLNAAARNSRYADVVAYRFVSRFDEEIPLQFAAVTFLLPDGSAYISFRGTDSTLAGWKEDFNLAFMTPVPAQTEALRYLETVADILSCPLRVGGHSKGGNLAVYASAFCRERTQERILEIFNNDGPGHDLTTIRSEGYQRVLGRMTTILPKSSVIGMLLEHGERYRVVDSDARGLFQHNPYSWQTRGSDFAYLPRTTAYSERLNESIREWLTGMDAQKRKFLTDTVFDVLSASDARTLGELRHNPHVLTPIFAALMKLNPEDRRAMTELLFQFAKTAASQYGQLAADTIQPFRNFRDVSRDENAGGAEKWNALKGVMDMIRERFVDTEDGK